MRVNGQWSLLSLLGVHYTLGWPLYTISNLPRHIYMVNDYNGDSGHDENNDDDEKEAVWSVGLRMQWVLATPYTVSRRAHNMNNMNNMNIEQLVLLVPRMVMIFSSMIIIFL